MGGVPEIVPVAVFYAAGCLKEESVGSGAKKLSELLEQKKGKIVEEWVSRIHHTYPEETAAFLQEEKNEFANPIGDSIQQSVWPLYDR